MIRKIVLGISGLAISAAFPAATLAQSGQPSIVPFPEPNPRPLIRLIDVTPGHPFEITSCGKLEVKGRGLARLENLNGSAEIAVLGKFAVKKEDLNSVKTQGFRSKHRRGNYIVFSGRGTASASGQDLDLVVFGTAKVESKGCGSTLLKGHWQGSFQPLLVTYPYPRPIPLPTPLPI